MYNVSISAQSGISSGYYSGKGFYSITVRRKVLDDTSDTTGLSVDKLIAIIFGGVVFVILLLIVITGVAIGYM